MYETSNADEAEERITQKNFKKDVLHPKPGDCVICKYDDKVWVAFISSYHKSLIILKLSCCIRLDMINIIAILK